MLILTGNRMPTAHDLAAAPDQHSVHLGTQIQGSLALNHTQSAADADGFDFLVAVPFLSPSPHPLGSSTFLARRSRVVSNSLS
jgi:hypothetical protein